MNEAWLTVKWKKSSRSAHNGNCVEVARVGNEVRIRHSNDPDRTVLIYTLDEFRAFAEGIRTGEFDDIVEE